MLHASRNMVDSGNKLVLRGLRLLRSRLPAGWSVNQSPRVAGSSSLDAILKITSPDRRTGKIVLQTRTKLDPRRVQLLVQDLKRVTRRGTPLVLARYLGEPTRAHLKDSGINYLDLTGNAWIVLPRPGLYIDTQGAAEDPDRQERPARSLRGPKAGRIIRALIDHRKPPGVRELATLAGVDAGYVSRVLAFLDSQALITRVGRGRLESVDWPALLRRWAQEAPLKSRGTMTTFLEPRGLSALVARLAKSKDRYAVTGSQAATAFAPVAPPRLLAIWARDVATIAAKLGLRPAEAGANVLAIEPTDDSVFDGAIQRSDVWYAAPGQVAADLLTSPGRGPSEGDELIHWMQANEEKWRQ